MIIIKTKEEIELMRKSARILAGVIKELQKMVVSGVKTNTLNEKAEELIALAGAVPSFKGYKGDSHEPFPSALCISINEEVVHGVPSERKLKEGEIVSLDLGVFYNGFHSDMAVSLPVGKISSEADLLLKITKKCLKKGIAKAIAGNTFGDIGEAIQKCAESRGFKIIKELCGHGIGKNLHEEPMIYNFGKKATGEKIKEGMVFCIEPMISISDWQIKKAKDGFGWQTKDNSLAAHFEHTIAITEKGPEILTEI